jgi:hypothetical protein
LLLHEALLALGFLLACGLLPLFLFAALFFRAPAVGPRHRALSDDPSGACTGSAADGCAGDRSRRARYRGACHGTRRSTCQSTDTCAGSFSRCAFRLFASVRSTSGQTRRRDAHGDSDCACSEHDVLPPWFFAP